MGIGTTQEYQDDADTTHRRIGDSVLDADGKVIAVNAAIVPDYSGSNLGVPAKFVRQLLDEAGITLRARTRSYSIMSFRTTIHHIAAYIFIEIFLACGFAQANDWRPIKEQQGVQIYYRYPEESRFRQYQGEIVVNAKPDRVVRLLQDLEKISEWHYRTKQVTVLDMIDMTNAYVHIINTPPWPIHARDAVCKVSLRIDEAKSHISITLTSVKNQLPVTDQYIRIPKLEAEWLIRPVSDNASSVRYQMHMEPGGRIPLWLVNNFAMDVPLLSLIKLRQLLNSTKK